MSNHYKITFVTLTTLVANVTLAQVPPKAQAAQERAKTDSLTKENYQQTLQSLGIKLPVLPPMAEDPMRPKNSTLKTNGRGYVDSRGQSLTRSSWGAWVNYSEDSANEYTLPDPLVLKNGKQVTDAKTWWQQRRPEIVNDYETHVFGRIPKNTPKIAFETSDIDNNALDGTAIKKTITGRIDNSAYPAAQPVIKMVLYLPVKAAGPVPLMVIASSNTIGDAQTIKLMNSTGWAVAIFDTNAIQADNGAGLSAGIIGLMNKGKLRRPEQWGVLRAWSWGLSRALDYFDAHEMMALVAPRPLFITGGTQDIWADPLGEFKACVAATPVYTLLGKTGIPVTQLPSPDVSLINSELAFRLHEGGHTDSIDWPIFIEFAKKYFK
ncbi:hypothetical protein ACVWYN_002790 [Pedobacter sp. UYP24]